MVPSRTLTALALAVLALGLSACGKKQPPPPPPQATSSMTETLGGEVKSLQRDVARLGQKIVNKQGPKVENVPEMERYEQEALALAARVEAQAPHNEAAREPLIDASRDIADAAGALVTLANSSGDGENAVDRAQAALEASQTQLDEAAEDLLPRVPEEKRPDIEDLKKPPPELKSS
jgi:hypothetical protein